MTMDPIYVAKNAGARVCIFDKYITVKPHLLAKDVMIPLKEIASVESGWISLEINTKDRRSYKVSMSSKERKEICAILSDKLA